MALGIFVVLFFVAFKLLGLSDWDWLWVLSPLWIPFAIAGVVLSLLSFGTFLAYAIYIVLRWFVK